MSQVKTDVLEMLKERKATLQAEMDEVDGMIAVLRSEGGNGKRSHARHLRGDDSLTRTVWDCLTQNGGAKYAEIVKYVKEHRPGARVKSISGILSTKKGQGRVHRTREGVWHV